MPKAILELPEMPESCRKCKLNKWDVWEHHRYVSINVLVCAALGEECSDKGRRSDCPLKLVEGKDEQTNVKCKYCNSESVEIIARGTESILYKCKVCKMEFAKLNIKEVEP
jgi:hypothetical protein